MHCHSGSPALTGRLQCRAGRCPGTDKAQAPGRGLCGLQASLQCGPARHPGPRRSPASVARPRLPEPSSFEFQVSTPSQLSLVRQDDWGVLYHQQSAHCESLRITMIFALANPWRIPTKVYLRILANPCESLRNHGLRKLAKACETLRKHICEFARSLQKQANHIC